MPARARPLFRPAGLLFLAVCLLSLACGAWPEASVPTRLAYPAAPLPTLQTLACGMVLFALALWPVIQIRRSEDETGPYRLASAIELLMYVLAAGPFVAAGGWLGDASSLDVARVMLYLAGPFALSYVAGLWARDCPALRGPAVMLCLVVALGLPAGWYLCLEFVPGWAQGDLLARAAPLTHAWTLAQRHDSLVVAPGWAFLVYPLLAGAMAVCWAGRKRSGH